MSDPYDRPGSLALADGRQGTPDTGEQLVELLAQVLVELRGIREAVETGAQAAAVTATAVHGLVTSRRVARWLGG